MLPDLDGLSMHVGITNFDQHNAAISDSSQSPTTFVLHCLRKPLITPTDPGSLFRSFHRQYYDGAPRPARLHRELTQLIHDSLHLHDSEWGLCSW
jgi:hypothetical protein